MARDTRLRVIREQILPAAARRSRVAGGHFEYVAGARLVVVPICGHRDAIEQPEAVTRARVEWRSA